MIAFTHPVKFKGTETFEGTSKKGNDYSMQKAKLFVEEMGIVEVLVKGKPKFPELNQLINIRLSVEQGDFKTPVLIYDENTLFTAVK